MSAIMAGSAIGSLLLASWTMSLLVEVGQHSFRRGRRLRSAVVPHCERDDDVPAFQRWRMGLGGRASWGIGARCGRRARADPVETSHRPAHCLGYRGRQRTLAVEELEMRPCRLAPPDSTNRSMTHRPPELRRPCACCFAISEPRLEGVRTSNPEAWRTVEEPQTRYLFDKEQMLHAQLEADTTAIGQVRGWKLQQVSCRGNCSGGTRSWLSRGGIWGDAVDRRSIAARKPRHL